MLARQLGVYAFGSADKVELSCVTAANRIPALQGGKIDVIVATLGVSEERAKVIDFSDSYAWGGSDVLTLKDSPIGELLLLGDGEALHGLYIQDGRRPIEPRRDWQRRDGAFAAAREQLDEYFAGTRTSFDLPLVLNGPPGSGLPHISGLPGLIHATRRATAVVGVDSGPIHIAAALGKPGVAIFGPTDPKRHLVAPSSYQVFWKEVQCSPCYLRSCPIGHVCSDGVSHDDVMREVERLL